MENKKRKLKLFFTMLRIGCIGFGGGNALVPVLYDQSVKRQHLVDEAEYDEDVMIASITPGALPIEVACGIGHRTEQSIGALLGAYGMAIPGVALTILLLIFFEFLTDEVLLQIRFLTVGVSAFITVLLTEYISSTIRYGKETKRYDVITIIAVFVLTGGKSLHRLFGIDYVPVFGLDSIDIFVLAFFLIFCNSGKVSKYRKNISAIITIAYVLLKGQGIPIKSQAALNIIYVMMFVMSALGLALSIRKNGKEIKLGDKSRFSDIGIFTTVVIIIFVMAVCVTGDVFEFAWKGMLSSLISYGGGDAYLTVADGIFIESGFVSENEFYGLIVPVVNVLPGSILCKMLSGIGFFIGHDISGSIFGGIIVAILGASVGIFASCSIFSLSHACYGIVSEIDIFVVIKKWIKPIVSGLMTTVILSLICQIRNIVEGMEGWFFVLLMPLLYVAGILMNIKKFGNIKILLIEVFLAFIVCNLLSDFVVYL